MKNNNYQLDPDAIIRSLRSAFRVPRDYSPAIMRLTNTINRLPKGRLQIVHMHDSVYFYLDRKYLRKDSGLLYPLARKRYCETLLQIITLQTQRPGDPNHASRLTKAFGNLEQLIRDFAKAKLILDRIVLTPQQYAWFHGRYMKKTFIQDPTSEPLLIPQGDLVRSKSEQHIGIELHNFAVPCHYEEQLTINVQRLVTHLEKELQERNLLQGYLYTYQGFTCHWNVPDHLSWMNAPGSIWRNYNDRTGFIRLYPDYTIMLADARLLYWEHEGLMHQFFYRTNALERIEIIHQAGGIPKTRLIETNESQANDTEALREIIRREILPWLWF